jgi:hypothetical protein
MHFLPAGNSKFRFDREAWHSAERPSLPEARRTTFFIDRGTTDPGKESTDSLVSSKSAKDDLTLTNDFSNSGAMG